MNKLTPLKILGIWFFVFSIFTIGCEKKDSSTNKKDTTNKSEAIHEDSTTLAKAILDPISGSKVKGVVTFVKDSNGVRVIAFVEGLTPGKHGFHIHEKGDCSSPDGSSAGGHFNPMSMEHSGRDKSNKHEGDMGNIVANDSGKAHLEYVDHTMSFNGANSIIGKGVIVHEKEDDLVTQPTGNSGGRIACGVIEKIK